MMKLRAKQKENISIDEQAAKLARQLVKVLEPDADLDAAVKRFPMMFYRVCDAYADAVNAQRAAKEKYELAYSEAEQEVWQKSKGEKLTVARTKSLVEANARVVYAGKRLRRTTDSVTKLEALRMAFQQKASMMKLEGELISSQYSQRDHLKPKSHRYG